MLVALATVAAAEPGAATDPAASDPVGDNAIDLPTTTKLTTAAPEPRLAAGRVVEVQNGRVVFDGAGFVKGQRIKVVAGPAVGFGMEWRL